MIMFCGKNYGLRQLNQLCRNISKYQFNSYRNFNNQGQGQNRYQQSTHNYRQKFKKDYPNKRLFRPFEKNNKNFENKSYKNFEDETNVEQYIKNINQINKQFLGIKLNTNYFKIYTEKKFQDIIKPDTTQSYKIHDLPFNVTSNKEKEQVEAKQSKLNDNLATKMLNKMISEQRLVKQMQVLVKQYFKDIFLRQRKCKMEPNFEMYSRRVVETLKSQKTSIKLANVDSNPKIVLKNVTIFKGVKVNRNDNYTIDSYQINHEEQQQNIITYTLWKKQRQQYPQNQWLAQKFIMARIEAEVSDAPVVEVVEQNTISSSNKGVTHSFVFEVDLTVPPALAALSLTPQQYLNSYRLKPENLQISNVDNKNIFFNLAFKEEDKKHRLLNKII